MPYNKQEFEKLAAANASTIDDLERITSRSSPQNKELEIRQAIARFVSGTTKADHDGSWTATNLIAESGIPKATVYRYETAVHAFYDLAEVAPAGARGLREQLREAQIALNAEKAARREDRKQFEQAQSIYAQRLYALGLAYAHATGNKGLVDLLAHKGGD